MTDSPHKGIAVKVIYGLLTLGLFALVAISVLGETIPVNDGAGFDGEFYREVFRNFFGTFFSTGYDSFRIQRIFPFCLMNVVYTVAGIPRDNPHMITGMYVLLFVNLALQVYLFFRFALFLKWKSVTTVILFALFFLNFATLKGYGYEPFQTDPYAITIALATYYLFAKRKKRAAFAVSLLGLITWPTITYVMALLLLFPHRLGGSSSGTPHAGKFANILDKPFPKIFQVLPIAYGLVAGALVLLFYAFHKQANLEGLLLTAPCPRNIAISLGLFTLISFLFAVCLKIPTIPYSIHSYIRSFDVKAFAGTALCIVAVSLLLRMFTNDEFFFDSKLFLLQIIARPLKYPLISFAGHVVYWGTLVPVILVLAKGFTRNFAEKSPGHALVLLAFLFFALDSEARHIATFVPLLLPALGKALDDANLTVKPAVYIVILQLLLAHFYITINVPGLAESLESAKFTTRAAQRYLMNYGPWMTHRNYMDWLAIAFCTFASINEVFKRNKLPQKP